MKTDIFAKSKKSKSNNQFDKVYEVLTNTPALLLPDENETEMLMAGDLVYLLKTEKGNNGNKFGIVRLLNHWTTPKQHCIYAVEMTLLKPYEAKEETSSAEGGTLSSIKSIDMDRVKPILLGGAAAGIGYWCGVQSQADVKIPPYVWALAFAVGGYYVANYYVSKNKLSKIEKNVTIS